MSSPVMPQIDREQALSEGETQEDEKEKHFLDSTSSSPPTLQLPTDTSSLDALQSEEQKKILNIVDSLRQCGLEGIVSLPQLVVCGDQSSGKSSVLEAITEIPFPRKENLCTRFATEIVLRRAPTSSIETNIIPDPTRPQSEQTDLKGFKNTIMDFKELPRLIEEVTKQMGLGEDASGTRMAFAKDILRIEISGPRRPQLTLVDLPGLIHAENKFQTREDVQVVAEVSHQYISNPRTIILPIISAKNDYANQVILNRARDVDQNGSRTLGIITKPDELHANSENETAFINLAKNDDIHFALGWHVLKNRGFKDGTASFSERNRSEQAFFSQGNWTQLSRNSLGIDTLRTRLSDLLFQHVKEELPKLHKELKEKHEETTLALKKLGTNRATESEQRHFLIQLGMQFYDLAKAGVGGYYEARFFAQEGELLSPKVRVSRRLRAVVQQMNIGFAQVMRKEGHKFQIGNPPMTNVEKEADAEAEAGNVLEEDDEEADEGEDDKDSVSDESSASAEKTIPPSGAYDLPEILTHTQGLDWVQGVFEGTRGKELPGNFNPLLIGELFWEQSEKWEEIALGHTAAVAEECSRFVETILQNICPADISSQLQGGIVDDSLKQRFERSQIELGKLFDDRRRHPITYNHYYTSTVQRLRRPLALADIRRVIDNATTTTQIYNSQRNVVPTYTVNANQIAQALRGQNEADMDRHSCKDALNALRAFYKVSLKTFVDNVTTQVIERHIVHRLEDVFSPELVATLDQQDLSNLAAEPMATVRQREHLEERKRAIENGQAVFRSVLPQTWNFR